jgi:predicted RNase H-like nuclease (RuvC/YqgF family)
LNHEQKRELEEWYKIKTEEVEREVQEEGERVRVQTTGMSSEDAGNLRQSATDSSREFAALQTKHIELSTRLRQLEELYEHHKSENSLALSEREREISILREKISELMSTYDELLGRKTSLEFEINTYRRLLECEETRIKTTSEFSSGGASSSFHYKSKASASSSSGDAGIGNVSVNVVLPRPRGASVEQTTETVMKRMQVQRTSKGNSIIISTYAS